MDSAGTQPPLETGMSNSSFDPKAHARAMRGGGWWRDQTLDDVVAQPLVRHPGKTAVVAYRVDRPEPVRFDYAELGRRIARVAGSLQVLGVGRGDVVSVQLPNWWEFVVLAF